MACDCGGKPLHWVAGSTAGNDFLQLCTDTQQCLSDCMLALELSFFGV